MPALETHATLVAELANMENLSSLERLKTAKKRRAQQLKKFAQYERQLDKQNNKKFKANKNVKLILNEKKFKVNFVDSTKFLDAASRNDIIEVRDLLKYGVSPDVTTEDGLTALHQCCIDDSEEMMHLLMEFNANVNARDTELWTPLHAAATCGHMHLCRSLVENGADLLAVNADGNMPYDICEDEVTLNYIESEMSKRDVTQDLIDDLRVSTENNMLNDMKNLANENGDLEFLGRYSETPLHVAAANGYYQVAEFLLQHNVKVNSRDEDLWSPLHAGSCWGHLAIVELLAYYGADLEAVTKTGETPFDICEDPEMKKRISDLKIEIENNKMAITIDKYKRRSLNTRSNIYSSMSSLCDRNQFSASVRRTSMREKSAISLKEAKEEALIRNSSVDVDEEEDEEEEEFSVKSKVINGNNNIDSFLDYVPTTNIDDVNMTEEDDDVTDMTKYVDSSYKENPLYISSSIYDNSQIGQPTIDMQNGNIEISSIDEINENTSNMSSYPTYVDDDKLHQNQVINDFQHSVTMSYILPSNGHTNITPANGPKIDISSSIPTYNNNESLLIGKQSEKSQLPSPYIISSNISSDLPEYKSYDVTNQITSKKKDVTHAKTDKVISKPSYPAPVPPVKIEKPASKSEIINNHPSNTFSWSSIYANNPPSGTLADLKRQRAMALQQKLREHNKNFFETENSDFRSSTTYLIPAEHSKPPVYPSYPATVSSSEPTLHRYTYSSQSEIIGEDMTEHCCVIL